MKIDSILLKNIGAGKDIPGLNKQSPAEFEGSGYSFKAVDRRLRIR